MPAHTLLQAATGLVQQHSLTQSMIRLKLTKRALVTLEEYALEGVNIKILLMKESLILAQNVFVLQDNENIYVFSRQSMKQAMNPHAYLD